MHCVRVRLLTRRTAAGWDLPLNSSTVSYDKVAVAQTYHCYYGADGPICYDNFDGQLTAVFAGSQANNLRFSKLLVSRLGLACGIREE
jgi:hypothetical protein